MIMMAITNFKTNHHFNVHSYGNIQIHSPSWFAQQLHLVRVKQANGSRAWYDGSLCVLIEYRVVNQIFRDMYFQRFFMADPMDCLRVMFSAPCYRRLKL